MSKKTSVAIVISLLTIILGTFAVFTAYNMWQKGSLPIAPNVPESEPRAVESEPRVPNRNTTITPPVTEITQDIPPVACALAFTVSADNIVPTPKTCFQSCTVDTDCATNLTCSGEVMGGKVCANSTCPQEEDCVCAPGATPTVTQPPAEPTNTPTAPQNTPTNAPVVELPKSGNSMLTFGAIATGIMTLGLAIFLIF